MGGPIHRAAQIFFPIVNFQLVRTTFRERIRILAQEVERGRFFRGEFGRGQNLLGRRRRRHFGEELDVAIALQAGAGGDQAAHDDVFLEAAQVVHLAGDGGFGEHARGLLEAGGADERIGRERRLGDAEEQRAPRGGAGTLADDAVVFLAEAELVHLLVEEERRVADVFHFHPTHHLADDRLDVLVVDVDALEAVDLLDGVHQVRLRVLFAEHGQQIVRVERAVDQRLARLDVFAFLHVDVHAADDRVFLLRPAVFAFDVNLPETLADFAVFHDAVDFADDGRVARLAGLEEFDDARQTSGDVLGLGGLARNFREHVSRLHLVAILHHQVRTGRHEIFFACGAGGVANLNRRRVFFIARRQRDDQLRQACDFVDLFLDGDAGLKVLELDRASGFGEDRERVRVPFGKEFAELDGLVFLDAQARAVDHVVALLFTAFFVDDGDQAVAVHGDQVLAAAAHDVHVDEAHEAAVAGLELGLFGDARRRSADVERAHSELRARLADGLRGDDADRFAEFDEAPGGQVASIAAGASAAAGFAGQHGANVDALDAGSLHGVGQLLADLLVYVNDNVAFVILDLVERNAAHNTVAQRLDFDARLGDRFDEDAVGGAAIDFADDHVLRHIDEAPREVAGIGRLERRVGESFARAVRRDEVLQHGQAFAEVGRDRRFDDFARGLGHQAAHPGKLADLLFRSAGAGIGHDVNRVDDAFLVLVLHGLEHLLGDFFGDVAPDGDDFVVAFAVGDGAVEVLLLHLDDFLLRVLDEREFVARDDHVVDADRDTGLGGVLEAQFLQFVEHLHGALQTKAQVAVIAELLHAFFLDEAIDKRHFLGQVIVENHAPDGGVDELALQRDRFGVRHVLIVVGGGEIDHFAFVTETNRREEFDFAGLERQNDFLGVAEGAAFALGAGLGLGQIVDSQNHVLRRNGERQAVGRRENVVRRKHQDGGFHLRFGRKRNVHGHLVAVKVRVERGADERMDANGLAFDEHRLKRLNAEAVQRGSAVQKHRMLANHFLEDVPNHGLLLLDHFLGLLDGGAVALRFQAMVDERLEQLERHLLRQAALVQLEFRANDDHGTSRIIDALAEQVLAEAALLSLERVGKRFERAVVRAAQNAAAASVIEQRVHGFLKHALFVADDDVRRVQLHQFLQAVVAVDDASIEIVQIGRGETPAVQRHEGTQLRRKNRKDIENHPFGAVAALAERFDHLQPLGVLDALLQARVDLHLFAQFFGEFLDVHALQKFLDGFRAHLRAELPGKFLLQLAVFFLGEHLAFLDAGNLERIDDHVALEIQDALEIAHRDVQEVADAGRQALEKPDVRAGRSQLDVSEALAANLAERDFHAALVADHAAVLHALILAAETFPVRDGTENFGAQQAVALGFEGTVVDGLRLGDFAVRPGPDFFRTRKTDPDRIEIGD